MPGKRFGFLKRIIFHSFMVVLNSRQARIRWLAIVALAATTLSLYWPVRNFEFIALDDPDYVTENVDIREGITWPGIRWAFTQSFSGNWHPLTWLSHMLDCQLFGVSAGPHHAENVFIHLANAFLVLLFFTRFTGRFWRGFIVAAVFALHPLQIESVAWVAERKNVLSTFFGLLALYSYGRYAVRRRLENKQTAVEAGGTIWYGLALVLYALGLMSKPMLVTWPFVLLLMDYWPLERFSLNDLFARKAGLARLTLEKVPFLVLTVLSSAMTVWAQSKGNAIATLELFPLANRVVNALVSYSGYVVKMFLPWNLCIYYPFPLQREYGLAVLSALAIAVVVALSLAASKKKPYLVTGVLWYLGTLIPVIGIVQVGGQAMADRYFYVPSIGLLAALVWLVSDLCARSGRLRFLGSSTGVAVMIACVLMTPKQLQTWRNNRSVFEHARNVTDGNYVALTVLGGIYGREGKLLEAENCLKAAAQAGPLFPAAWFGLGSVLYDTGKHAEALQCFRRVLEIDPHSPEGMDGYAFALMREKDLDAAEKWLRQALQLRPKLPGVHLHLAMVLQERGNATAAEREFEMAITYKPDDTTYRLSYAEFLRAQKLPEQAKAQALEALRLEPNSLAARLTMAGLEVEMGQVAQAAARFSDVLARWPTNSTALDGYGYTLAIRNKPDEAFPYFRKAVDCSPTNGFAQLHLAMELERRGEPAKALEHYAASARCGKEFTLAMNNAAWLLATHPDPNIRNGRRGVEYGEEACQITSYKEAFFVGTLAAAYAEAGRFEEAVQTAQKAIDLATAAGNKQVAERNQDLMRLYRAGKPYHETGNGNQGKH